MTATMITSAPWDDALPATIEAKDVPVDADSNP